MSLREEMIKAQAKDEVYDAILRWWVTILLVAFEGGWLLMLLAGVVAHQTGDSRWAIGYWLAVPVAVGVRVLYHLITSSSRKYALPPPPVVRR